MNRQLVPLFVPLAALALLAACGDDDDGNSGPNTCDYTPCGGDPTGTWRITRGCLEEEMLPVSDYPECADAVVSGRPRVVGGSETLNADGTYQFEARVRGDFRFRLPEECVAALSDGEMTVEEYCTAFPLLVQFAGLGTATCEVVGNDCSCNVSMDSTSSETGQWRVEGDRLLTLSDEFAEFGEWDSTPFCVDGDTLSVGEPGEGVIATR
jgi:hypothetical protein